jgi:hypothetical protein
LGARDEFNKQFCCGEKRGKLVHKDRVRPNSQLFYCDCSDKNKYYFNFVHNRDVDKVSEIINGIEHCTYLLRAFTMPKIHNSVREHFIKNNDDAP